MENERESSTSFIVGDRVWFLIFNLSTSTLASILLGFERVLSILSRRGLAYGLGDLIYGRAPDNQP